MALKADVVVARDGRWLGERCRACGVVFIRLGRQQAYADHTWTHHDDD